MFNSARFKLTIWYLAIIMAISFAFSTIIYKVSTNELERFDRVTRARFERGFFFHIPTQNASLVQEAEQRLILNLLIINLSIAILSGGTSYFLAGVTLKPIKDMVDNQSRFISDASHELSTPLTSLKTAMEVYLRDKKGSLKDAKIIISESITEVNKLQSLSQSLLQLAQYDEPLTNHHKFEKVSLKLLIDNTLKKLSPLAKRKNIKIMSDINKNIFLRADKYSLTDLFILLLDNAIKYSHPQGKISISATKIKTGVEIKIKDQGIGIDQKDLPHIFDRFYRSDIARSKKTTNGYGLGLAIAKKIVTSHHGTIKVQSKPNQGTTFLISLPVPSY